eukprot:238666-Prymnesium_polylepis.1
MVDVFHSPYMTSVLLNTMRLSLVLLAYGGFPQGTECKHLDRPTHSLTFALRCTGFGRWHTRRHAAGPDGTARSAPPHAHTARSYPHPHPAYAAPKRSPFAPATSWNYRHPLAHHRRTVLPPTS